MRNGTQSDPRRGRPPAYDRRAALKAIVETFRRQGFAATSLDDLATATGMNRPSLYAAFGNKKAMYLAALEQFRRDMIEAVDATAEQSSALPETLIAFFDAAIRFYCSGTSPGCLVLCTAPTEAAVDDEIRAKLTGVLAEIEHQIRRRVDRVVAMGARVHDASALSQLMSAVLVSVAIQARAGVPEPQLRALARASVAVALSPPNSEVA